MALGLRFLGSHSNEVESPQGRGVIKTSRKSPYIGILKEMLPKLQVIYPVLLLEDAKYEVRQISRAEFDRHKFEPGAKKSRHLWFMRAADARQCGKRICVLESSPDYQAERGPSSHLASTEKVSRYALPQFLMGVITSAAYARWLQRKAQAHVVRDRKVRGNKIAKVSEYKRAIHDAVCASGGLDAYTGEPLAWRLMSQYNNEKSRKGRREYKAGFALLPTVDHVGDGTGPADFKICAWRTNDAKTDMKYEDFLALCHRVVLANQGMKK